MEAGMVISDRFGTCKSTEVLKNKHCQRTGKCLIFFIFVLKIWDTEALRYILIQRRK